VQKTVDQLLLRLADIESKGNRDLGFYGFSIFDPRFKLPQLNRFQRIFIQRKREARRGSFLEGESYSQGAASFSSVMFFLIKRRSKL
jgi:hypothetical protein